MIISNYERYDVDDSLTHRMTQKRCTRTLNQFPLVLTKIEVVEPLSVKDHLRSSSQDSTCVTHETLLSRLWFLPYASSSLCLLVSTWPRLNNIPLLQYRLLLSGFINFSLLSTFMLAISVVAEDYMKFVLSFRTDGK